MKSFYTVGVVWLASMVLITVAAQGQANPTRLPAVLSYSKSQAFSNTNFAPASTAYVSNTYPQAQGHAAPPAYGTHAYAPTSTYAATPVYTPMPHAVAAPPRMAYPQPVGTRSTFGPPQPSYANFALPQARFYAPPAPPFYWPASTGQSSVMLHNGEAIGGPPLAQPHPHVDAHGAAPAYGYAPTQGQLWTDAYAAGSGESCVSYAPARAQNWFAAGSGLIMTRDHGDHYNFSYGTLAEEDQRTNTRDAAMDWSGGFDVRLGRYFNCGRNAIEAVYWGISPERQSTQTVSADVSGNLNAILNFGDLNYGGTSAADFVNVAPGIDGIHRVQREFDFQNLEVNVWQLCTSCGGGACDCSRFRFNWLAGVRYFRFNENLLFGADAYETQLTFDDDDELYYNIDVQNYLVGFQLGNELEYSLSCKWTLDMGVKLGLYGNNIKHVSEIGGGYGVATIDNGPFAGRAFYVNNRKKDVAFLGEARIGLQYCINPCWTATLGYRAFAVTGVALPSEQIYPDLRGINDVEIIDSNGSLILHGGYAGLEYCW